jgi:hypothetical protein
MINAIKPKSQWFMKFLGYIIVFPGLIFVSVGIAGFFENS